MKLKRRMFYLIFLLNIPLRIYCQDSLTIVNNELIGLWQSKTNEIGSSYLDTYTFFSNGNFIFRPTPYNGLNRIIEIKGTYKLEGSVLTFSPDSIYELTGGSPERSKVTTLSDSWSIENGALIKTKVLSNPQAARIEKIHSNDITKLSYILIDKRSFYKISNRPE